jgi:hypothetical protein
MNLYSDCLLAESTIAAFVAAMDADTARWSKTAESGTDLVVNCLAIPLQFIPA